MLALWAPRLALARVEADVEGRGGLPGDGVRQPEADKIGVASRVKARTDYTDNFLD